jgi:hypothetical protein
LPTPIVVGALRKGRDAKGEGCSPYEFRKWTKYGVVVEVLRWCDFLKDCAGFVLLELQAKATKTSEKPNAETRVVIGSGRLLLFPVSFEFALITQRSEVQILPPQSGAAE